MAVDPSSGTIPTGYLILNVTTGHIKRHAGGYVWELPGVLGRGLNGTWGRGHPPAQPAPVQQVGD